MNINQKDEKNNQSSKIPKRRKKSKETVLPQKFVTIMNKPEKDYIVIKKKLFNPIENYDSEEMMVFMKKFSEFGDELFLEKDNHYGGSWMKDGGIGAFLNLKRKWDRLFAAWKNGKIFESDVDLTGETVFDTLLDLMNYTRMFAGYVAKTSSNEDLKKAWFEKIGIKYDESSDS